MKCWRNVTVDIKRYPDRAVTQHLLNHLGVSGYRLRLDEDVSTATTPLQPTPDEQAAAIELDVGPP
jgi:hypothetical protein